ncbi:MULTISPECIES: DUF2805 domain-containing protein [Flavobacterium]|uniref:DUF2805 domain-containing protein n=1 Tax=Flavobacterium aurantiibacter TaxID=2023067 RepID=A0A255ZVP6_9FLAO|nr:MULTISPECIES: DUF2805 domain-containing protein [Flavobacterium]OYQ45568.1 hypothetical protein CHX27_05765 [Flavobacterium aurantiibacter]
MKKSKHSDLTREQIEKVMSLALEEKNPLEIIKKDFGWSANETIDFMKSKLTADKFELWKKKAQAAKPKPKPIRYDDFDDELDGKYYIKNKFD